MKLLTSLFVLVLAGQQPAPKVDLLGALSKAEALWQKQKPVEYEFRVQVQCFCLGVVNPPPAFRVTAAGVEPVKEMSAESQRLYGNFNTVEKLFAAIRRSLERGQFKSAVDYDPEMGFPTKADLDPFQNIADDELALRVTGFKKIKTNSR